MTTRLAGGSRRAPQTCVGLVETVGAPDDVVVASSAVPQTMLRRRPRCPRRCCRSLSDASRGRCQRARRGAPDDVVAVGAAALRAPDDVVRSRRRALVPQTMLSSSRSGATPTGCLPASRRCPTSRRCATRWRRRAAGRRRRGGCPRSRGGSRRPVARDRFGESARRRRPAAPIVRLPPAASDCASSTAPRALRNPAPASARCRRRATPR